MKGYDYLENYDKKYSPMGKVISLIILFVFLFVFVGLIYSLFSSGRQTAAIFTLLIFCIPILIILLVIIFVFRAKLKYGSVARQKEIMKKYGIKTHFLGGFFDKDDIKLEEGENVIKYYPAMWNIPSNRTYFSSIKKTPRKVSLIITNKRIILPNVSIRTRGYDPKETTISAYFLKGKKDKDKIWIRKVEKREMLGFEGAIVFFLVPKQRKIEPSYLMNAQDRALEEEGFALEMNFFFPENVDAFIKDLNLRVKIE